MLKAAFRRVTALGESPSRALSTTALGRFRLDTPALKLGTLGKPHIRRSPEAARTNLCDKTIGHSTGMPAMEAAAVAATAATMAAIGGPNGQIMIVTKELIMKMFSTGVTDRV